MICHVCREQASGQCRECLKFYCPDHGDGRCMPCIARPPQAYVPSPPPPPPRPVPVPPPPVVPSRPAPEELYVASARGCFECKQPTTIKCDGCDNHFCARHGFGTPGWGDTKFTCNACKEFNQMLGCILGPLVAIAIAVVMFAFVGRGFR